MPTIFLQLCGQANASSTTLQQDSEAASSSEPEPEAEADPASVAPHVAVGRLLHTTDGSLNSSEATASLSTASVTQVVVVVLVTLVVLLVALVVELVSEEVVLLTVVVLVLAEVVVHDSFSPASSWIPPKFKKASSPTVSPAGATQVIATWLLEFAAFLNALYPRSVK